jgi:hypothetical protein
MPANRDAIKEVGAVLGDDRVMAGPKFHLNESRKPLCLLDFLGFLKSIYCQQALTPIRARAFAWSPVGLDIRV